MARKVLSGSIYPVTLVNTNGVPSESPEYDDIEGAAVGIDLAHHMVHEGDTYSISYKTPDASPIADDAYVSIQISTGAVECHVLFSGTSGGDAEAQLLEAPLTTDGDAATPYNHKRRSTKASATTCKTGVTVSTLGTQIDVMFIAGGTRPQSVGGGGSRTTEWNLKPNTTYVARIINRAGTAQPAFIRAEWYEVNV